MRDPWPCTTNHDPELWMSDEVTERRLAASLCGTCPVKAACRQGADDRDEEHGIWGGEDFSRVDALGTREQMKCKCGCGKTVTQSHAGRRRVYYSRKCQNAFTAAKKRAAA